MHNSALSVMNKNAYYWVFIVRPIIQTSRSKKSYREESRSFVA